MLISIIVSTHDFMSVLQKAINKLLMIGQGTIEFILCFDLQRILKHLTVSNDDVKVIAEDTQYTGHIKNKALELARGKYIWFWNENIDISDWEGLVDCLNAILQADSDIFELGGAHNDLNNYIIKKQAILDWQLAFDDADYFPDSAFLQKTLAANATVSKISALPYRKTPFKFNMSGTNTTIWAAFNGCGKSTFCRKYYDWLEFDEAIYTNSSDLSTFCRTAIWQATQGYSILVSANMQLLSEFKKLNCDVILILPSKEMKAEILSRIMQRGESAFAGWAADLARTYEERLDELEQSGLYDRIVFLKHGEYVEDAITRAMAEDEIAAIGDQADEKKTVHTI